MRNAREGVLPGLTSWHTDCPRRFRSSAYRVVINLPASHGGQAGPSTAAHSGALRGAEGLPVRSAPTRR